MLLFKTLIVLPVKLSELFFQNLMLNLSFKSDIIMNWFILSCKDQINNKYSELD